MVVDSLLQEVKRAAVKNKVDIIDSFFIKKFLLINELIMPVE